MVEYYKEKKRKSIFLQKIEKVKFEDEEEEKLLKGFDYKRLYEHYMKELFIYNGYWSKKEYFFKEKAKIEENEGDKKINENKIIINNNDDDNDSKLKYKQLSYYTRNYQQPILYPILQYDKYIPNIQIVRNNAQNDDPQNSNFYNHNIDKIVKYNFSLSGKMKGIFNPNDNKLVNKEEVMRCCLVKKMYHVKGKFYLKKTDKSQNDFSYIFISEATQDSHEEGPFCHFKINNVKRKECFGLVLPCCKKEFNKKYIFESTNIMFLIIRNYYAKTSAIEIFTYNPYKSYYFNFENLIKTKNKLFQYLKKNFILIKHELKDIKDKIKLYYNKYYSPMLFPFIKDKKLNLDNMSKFYNNYDLLTIINILANRSFRDIYQYPAFPLLYKPSCIDLKYKRDMSHHVGLQPFEEASRKKDFILKGYDDEDKKPYLLNTYFSNSIFVSNFLVRLFPYAILAIKLQGNYFDTPARLFFSVEKATLNTFKDRADNREYIPELYYLPDIFMNRNEFFFGLNKR